MPALPALAAVLLLAAGAEPDGSVRVQATLHLRATSTRGVPAPDVLFDRERSTFALERYLAPGEAERHGSLLASLRLDGSFLGGDLRWAVAADTGEVRRQAFPRLQDVCLVRPALVLAGARTGLAIPGSRPGICGANLGVLSLEETRLDDAGVTANGRPIAEEARSTAFLREAYLAWSFGRGRFATARAGRKRTTIGDGLVHDDYATGVELTLDLGAVGPPFELSVGLFQPTRDFPRTVAGLSPVLAARADWLPSLFEHAGVFAAALRDRTGSVAELLRGAVVERRVGRLAAALGTPDEATEAQALARALAAPLTSDATLAWVGTSGSLSPWRGQRAGWTLAALGGTLHHLEAPTAAGTFTLAEDVPMRGRLASLRWDADIGRRVTAGASFLFLSGGAPPDPGGTYHGFIGITPYVTQTNLFFGGGLAETFAARQATAPGVNGRGVLAPGASLTVEPADGVTAVARGAWLRADVTGPFGGKVYGTELDLELTWRAREWLLVGAEVDVLWPGDFYAARDRISKAVLAVDFTP